jgi:NAD(P)-dependent dehydrogenase (short-subunit alcohol dehydrogenase family)
VLVSGTARGIGRRRRAGSRARAPRSCSARRSRARSSPTAGARFVALDVTHASDWKRAMEAAADPGGLDGLVNNAAICPTDTLETT